MQMLETGIYLRKLFNVKIKTVRNILQVESQLVSKGHHHSQERMGQSSQIYISQHFVSFSK